MYQILLVIFLLVAVCLVALIMLQQGKGADMEGFFGAGTSGILFGLSASSNFITRMTAVLAALFFILSLVLSNLTSNHAQKGRQWDRQWDNLNQNHQVPAKALKKSGNDIPQ